jgi:hypothetical protein
MIPLVLNTNRPTIKIKGIDVSDIIKQISLTESLFEPVLRGSFIVFDTASSRLYQIVGELSGLSPIEFSFHSLMNGSPEKEIISKDFFIYKYTAGANQGISNMLSQGYFGSKFIFLNETRMVSKYFDDTISNIVTKLTKELEITCKTTSSLGKVKKVLTYDSVFSHINTISKQARSSGNPKDVDFVFFQDIDHDFYFKPISEFKKKETKWKYKVLFPIADITVEQAKYSVLKHSVNEFAPIDNALNGMYSSEIISFDTTSGDYFSKTHVFNPDSYTKLSKKPIVDVQSEPLFGEIAKSGVAVKRFNKQRFLFDCSEPPSGYDEVGLEDDWVGNRMAAMQNTNQIILNLLLPGNSEMKVGDIMEFSRPVHDGMASSGKVEYKEKDYFYNGKYLITEITHDLVIKPGTTPDAATTSYTMRVKAVKDSMGDENA